MGKQRGIEVVLKGDRRYIQVNFTESKRDCGFIYSPVLIMVTELGPAL